MKRDLTHLRSDGSPHIVDVGAKKSTYRMAQAEGWVYLNSHTIQSIKENKIHKGDVLAIAQLAGICGVKRTADIIPLCHPIPIDAVEVTLSLHEKGVYIHSEVRNQWKTGVEMEAMMAITAAALCLYDMIKAIQKDAVIGDVRLLYKEGGKSGTFGEKKT